MAKNSLSQKDLDLICGGLAKTVVTRDLSRSVTGLRPSFQVLDDVYAASSLPEERERVKHWFHESLYDCMRTYGGEKTLAGFDTADPTKRDSTVIIEFKFDPSKQSDPKNQFEFYSALLRENRYVSPLAAERFAREWDKSMSASVARAICLEPAQDDPRLERAQAEIHRLRTLLAERGERLSSGWEHLSCVTTGLTAPVSKHERVWANALKRGGPR